MRREHSDKPEEDNKSNGPWVDGVAHRNKRSASIHPSIHPSPRPPPPLPWTPSPPPLDPPPFPPPPRSSKSPPPPCSLSAQISATTKRGCKLWAGSPWGPGNRGAHLLLPLPPPTEMGPDRKQSQHPPPPPACPRTLTAGRHMVIEVPQGADAERRVCWDLGPAC